MDIDMSCRGFKFEIGKTYHAEGDICLCKNGFHFCKNLCDVFRYYPEGRYFEIEASGDILSIVEGDKSVTSVIKVIRELPDDEINRCKYGDGKSYEYRLRYIYGDGYGNGNGDGYGSGNRYGYKYGDGCGCSYGNGDGYGDRCGDGDGYGYGNRSFQTVGIYI